MFPTTTGISEDEARGICQTGLSKATLYTRCHDEPGMNLTALVDSCMEDVKVDFPYIVTQPFTLKSKKKIKKKKEKAPITFFNMQSTEFVKLQL